MIDKSRYIIVLVCLSAVNSSTCHSGIIDALSKVPGIGPIVAGVSESVKKVFFNKETDQTEKLNTETAEKQI